MKKPFQFILLAILVASPVFVFAQTTSGITHNLYLGLRSSEVMLLQQKLQELGYFSSTIQPTGYFGLVTRKAAQDFQRDNGVSTTGYVGPLTRQALTKYISFQSSLKIISPSLHTITDLHLQDAKTTFSTPELFEVQLGIAWKGDVGHLNNVFSSFTQPGNDITYVQVSEWYQFGGIEEKFIYDAPKRNYDVGKHGFILVQCGGAYNPNCGKETGLPELPSKHSSLRNWKIDIKDVLKALEESKYPTVKNSGISITTIGRLKNNGIFSSGQLLDKFSDDRTVVAVVEAGTTAGAKLGITGHYVILDAENGKILTSGSYDIPGPPPAQ